MSAPIVAGYTTIRKIAEGGCAEIYEAQDQATRRKVVIKTLAERDQSDKEKQKRLVKEGELGLQVGAHPHIAQTYKIGRVEGVPYLIQEFAPGKCLRTWLRERQKLRNREILDIGRAIAKALQCLHLKGIFHKDIKPENVMYDGKESIKLIDFGVAETNTGFSISGISGLFSRKTLSGSPAYMAPELIQSKKPSEGSDLYALGCTLYELAAGRPPYLAGNDALILDKHLDPLLRPAPLFSVNDSISEATNKLILCTLVKDVSRRLATANQFLMELNKNPIFAPDSDAEMVAFKRISGRLKSPLSV
jgi:serine/threonine protein kinase